MSEAKTDTETLPSSQESSERRGSTDETRASNASEITSMVLLFVLTVCTLLLMWNITPEARAYLSEMARRDRAWRAIFLMQSLVAAGLCTRRTRPLSFAFASLMGIPTLVAFLWLALGRVEIMPITGPDPAKHQQMLTFGRLAALQFLTMLSGGIGVAMDAPGVRGWILVVIAAFVGVVVMWS